MKTAMVLKAKDVIRRGCLEYDVSATDITSSFMAIRKTMTSSGRSATYEASRSEEASHADLAWATMHALLNEPLQDRIREINGWLGQEVIRFKNYSLDTDNG